MIFKESEKEIRERLAETFSLLSHLRSIAPKDLTPLDDLQKTLRGLWIVSLYAAFERAANSIVEAALIEISSHGSKSIECFPPIHSIFHYAKVQSLKDCSNKRIFDTSIKLFSAALGDDPILLSDNPLAERLQNVDTSTLKWVSELFGAPEFLPDGSHIGRLSTLRERRNAVAHGRESASKVGERYTLAELDQLYVAADTEATRFRLHLEAFCTTKGYLRKVA
jgi:hypothetical protein